MSAAGGRRVALVTGAARGIGAASVRGLGDVRDPAALTAAVGTATQRWGRLDLAVAAAAVIAGGRPLWEDDSLDLQWQIDPSGCRFIALASAAGSRGLFHLAAHNAAKHAVVGLVKGLAVDLAGTGVTACAVSPGATDTAMLAATADLYSVGPGDLADHQLLRRPLSPDEVAATLIHACSSAGAVLNGADVAADGGFGG